MQPLQGRWLLVLILFFFTSIVESIGMSHVYSFLPVYLQHMNVAHVSAWVGVLNAITFLVGLPLVPLWGIWANRFGGKAVIIRSAYVEALVFMALALSHALPGVVVAMAMVGFQLGNTGIMLSSIRRLVPNHHIGLSVSLFSVSSPIGMALGPLAGGWLVNIGWLDLHGLFVVDAVLSIATGTMLLLFYQETKAEQEAAPEDKESIWKTAWKSIEFTFRLRITWILFGVYTLLMTARQMVNPYLPIAIEQLHTTGISDGTMMIGAMMGLTALVGAAIAIAAGKVGDKIGFTTILAIAFAMNVPATLSLGFTHNRVLFAICLAGNSAFVSIGGAMIFALLSTDVPDTHRSTALNLVYLPLYVGGIAGPAVASAVSGIGLWAPFVGSAVTFAIGLMFIAATLRRKGFVPVSGDEWIQEGT